VKTGVNPCDGHAVSGRLTPCEICGQIATGAGGHNAHKNAGEHDGKRSFCMGRLVGQLKEGNGGQGEHQVTENHRAD